MPPRAPLARIARVARPTRLSRPFSLSPLSHRGGTVDVQHVRLRRPLLTRSRIFKAVVWSTTLAVPVLYLFWLVEEEEEGEDVLDEEGTADEAFEDAMNTVRARIQGQRPEGRERVARERGKGRKVNAVAQRTGTGQTESKPGLLLPTSLPRAKPGIKYKRGDPEWLAFMAFENSPRHKQAVLNFVQHEVIKDICSRAEVKEMFGDNPRQYLTKSFRFNIAYPVNTPTEWELAGVGLTDEGIALNASTSISSAEAARIRSRVLPIPVFKSFWAGCQAAVFKLFPDAWFAPPPRIKYVAPGDPGPIMERRRLNPNPLPPKPTKSQNDAGSASTEDTGESSDPAESPRDLILSKLLPGVPAKYYPSAPVSPAGAATAAAAFRKASWQKHVDPIMPLLFEPPRGSLVIRGVMKLHDRNRGLKQPFRVFAAYDPTKKAVTMLGVEPVKLY